MLSSRDRGTEQVLDRALGDRSLNATQLGKMLTHAAGRKSGAASALDPADKQVCPVRLLTVPILHSDD